jgi:hypothetical protein
VWGGSSLRKPSKEIGEGRELPQLSWRRSQTTSEVRQQIAGFRRLTSAAAGVVLLCGLTGLPCIAQEPRRVAQPRALKPRRKYRASKGSSGCRKPGNGPGRRTPRTPACIRIATPQHKRKRHGARASACSTMTACSRAISSRPTRACSYFVAVSINRRRAKTSSHCQADNHALTEPSYRSALRDISNKP